MFRPLASMPPSAEVEITKMKEVKNWEWIGNRPAPSFSTPVAPTVPSVPTSTTQKDTSENDVSISSIYCEQQRLSSEQERMSVTLQRITADQRDLQRKCSNLSKMVKAIFDKLGCGSSSDDNDTGTE